VSDDYLAELSRRPAAYSPATLGEIWNAEWARSALDTLTGVGRPYQDSYDELVQGIEAAAGSDIATYAAQQKVRLGGGNTRDQNIAALGVLADTLPEERSQPLQPLKDVRKRAAEKAQALEKESGDVAAGTYGLTGTATAFLAGVARQALDPVNLATLPLGAGPGMGALRAIGAEALAAAGTQAAQEPIIQAERGRLGLEAGFSQGALNVAQAGDRRRRADGDLPRRRRGLSPRSWRHSGRWSRAKAGSRHKSPPLPQSGPLASLPARRHPHPKICAHPRQRPIFRPPRAIWRRRILPPRPRMPSATM
jgi:hypothetical protein